MRRAKDLLEDAEDFLGAALDLFKTGRWSKVCFNAQQAAELALKAVLNHYGIERRTHSLVDLLDELIKINEDFKMFQDNVKILDQYYIPTRYANSFASGHAKRYFTEQQAEQAIRLASSILEKARSIVTEGKTQ
ncbi:MAG: HEPN domain-containing protein [Candidatus Brockarchaeota archaeon]|nr:HEPN domain-containing protein [Candidatus Brockarchaeota archaeon]